MIYDHIENIEKYANDKKLYAALTSMKNHAEGGEAAGSAECFMSKSEYVTRPIEEAKLENHHKYIDIHYVLSGEEQILIDALLLMYQHIIYIHLATCPIGVVPLQFMPAFGSLYFRPLPVSNTCRTYHIECFSCMAR